MPMKQHTFLPAWRHCLSVMCGWWIPCAQCCSTGCIRRTLLGLGWLCPLSVRLRLCVTLSSHVLLAYLPELLCIVSVVLWRKHPTRQRSMDNSSTASNRTVSLAQALTLFQHHEMLSIDVSCVSGGSEPETRSHETHANSYAYLQYRVCPVKLVGVLYNRVLFQKAVNAKGPQRLRRLPPYALADVALAVADLHSHCNQELGKLPHILPIIKQATAEALCAFSSSSSYYHVFYSIMVQQTVRRLTELC